jgi:hypothetical protein
VEPENAIADSEDAIAKLADSDWENGRMGEGEIDRNEDSRNAERGDWEIETKWRFRTAEVED